MGLVAPLLRHWHPPSPLARLLILSFDISRSCLYLANRRKGDRTRHAGGRDSEEPREKPWKDRRESKQTERDRARSRGIGGRPRERERGREKRNERGEIERDRRHRDRKRAKLRCITPRDKERCSGGVRNRQWRGWTAAGRSRGREMVGRKGQRERGGEGEREREVKARREQPDRPTVYQSVIRAPSWV